VKRQPRAWKRGQGGVRKKGDVFYIRYMVGRKRVEERTDAANETDARKMLNEKLGDVAKGKTPPALSRVKLSELYADVVGDYKNRGQDLETLGTRWLHLERAFGDDFVRTVTHRRMQTYIEARRSENASEQTIKNEIAALRHMIRFGYFEIDPPKVAQLPSFPRIKVDNARQVFFEDEEFERLCKVIPEVVAMERNVGNDWLLPYVITARWTGARRNELLNLERRSLDVAVGKITLDVGSTKNKDGRIVYLPPAAAVATREWEERTKGFEKECGVIVRYVFHRRGEKIREFPYDLWHRAVAKAEIGGRRILHDFRRTAARSYRKAGVSEGVVMMIGGWKTRSVFERYNIKNEQDLQEAAAQVGQLGKEVGQRGGTRLARLANGMVRSRKGSA
jgi:integrase